MDRLVIVTKETRLEELVRQHMTEGAARFVLESRGQSIDAYRQEDAAYRAALVDLRRQIPGDLPTATVDRNRLPNFLFRDNDVIVVCGPDGLFVNTAKYVRDQPIICINPDPRTIAGVLMRFSPGMLGGLIASIRAGEHMTERLPFIKATIDDDRTLWGVNDVFIGRKDQISARYALSFEGDEEHQSSSGIIVATGVGSTGWMHAVRTMIQGVTGGRPHKLSHPPSPTEDELEFIVREPFPSPTTGIEIITGRITPEEPLTVVSEMPNGGYIFSDGVVEKALEWKAGSTVEISVGERYVQRIVR
ncbi:MAG TPA: hypothetical protein VN495_01995 [Candidatus Paceibacterota bacterium]|nr:hypothetical protein [Candidatus Paceibacterota bacterium]